MLFVVQRVASFRLKGRESSSSSMSTSEWRGGNIWRCDGLSPDHLDDRRDWKQSAKSYYYTHRHEESFDFDKCLCNPCIGFRCWSIRRDLDVQILPQMVVLGIAVPPQFCFLFDPVKRCFHVQAARNGKKQMCDEEKGKDDMEDGVAATAGRPASS